MNKAYINQQLTITLADHDSESLAGLDINLLYWKPSSFSAITITEGITVIDNNISYTIEKGVLDTAGVWRFQFIDTISNIPWRPIEIEIKNLGTL